MLTEHCSQFPLTIRSTRIHIVRCQVLEGMPSAALILPTRVIQVRVNARVSDTRPKLLHRNTKVTVDDQSVIGRVVDDQLRQRAERVAGSVNKRFPVLDWQQPRLVRGTELDQT